MPGSVDDLIRTFIARLSARDIEAAAAMVSADFEYDNVPMGKAFGPDGLRNTLTGFFAMLDDVDWQVIRQTSTGDMSSGTVLNERDDRVNLKGTWHSLPVAGVFEVRDGIITLWRDYFDRQTLMEIMEAEGRLPDSLVACIGGGSNYSGFSFPFMMDKLQHRVDSPEFVACEARAVPHTTRGTYTYGFGDTAQITPLPKMFIVMLNLLF